MTHSWDLEENCSILVTFLNEGSGCCHRLSLASIETDINSRPWYTSVYFGFMHLFFTQVDDDQSHFKQSFAAVQTKPTRISVSSSLVEGDKNKQASFFSALFLIYIFQPVSPNIKRVHSRTRLILQQDFPQFIYMFSFTSHIHIH